jgi:L-asparagine oxygenase
MQVVERLATRYSIEPAERGEVRELAGQMAHQLVTDAAMLDVYVPHTPRRLREVLRRFAANSNPEGYLLIGGLNIGEVPPTPNDHTLMSLGEHLTTGLLALVAENLGTLLGYAEEKHGALIHDVLPVRGEEEHIENSGSVAFNFHTENVHHPFRPDYLALLCLRQDHDGVGTTRVASVRLAQRLLTAEQVAVLRRPEFRSLYPASFTRGRRGDRGGRPRSEPHRVLFGPEHAPLMRFNSHNTQAFTDAGARALAALTEALEHVCHDATLEPGQMVIIDNHVAAHGRSAFAPRYDGRDRWLRRCYAAKSLPSSVRTKMSAPRVLPRLSDLLPSQ